MLHIISGTFNHNRGQPILYNSSIFIIHKSTIMILFFFISASYHTYGTGDEESAILSILSINSMSMLRSAPTL